MQSWLNFWILIFWLSFIFFINGLNNFIKLLFFSELIWVCLYVIVLTQSALNDDLNLLGSSLFILGLAGLEYSIGLVIVLIFKQINKNINVQKLDTVNNNFFENTKVNLNKFIWNYTK